MTVDPKSIQHQLQTLLSSPPEGCKHLVPVARVAAELVNLVGEGKGRAEKSGINRGNLSPYQITVAALFAKGSKSFNAIWGLLKRGFPEDAAVLARTLIESVIDLGFMDRVGRDLIPKRFMAFERFEGWVYVKNTRDDANPVLRETWERNKDKFQELEKEAMEIEAAYGFREKEGWHFTSLFQRAQKIGATRTYHDFYSLCSKFVHSSPMGLRNYLLQHPNGPIISDIPSYEETDMVASLSTETFMKLVEVWSDAWSLGLEEQIQSLRAKLGPAVEEMKKLCRGENSVANPPALPSQS